MNKVLSLIAVGLLLAPAALAQGVRPVVRPPSAEVLRQADAMADTVFTALAEGRTQDLAEWLNSHVGYAESPSRQAQNVSDYRAQFEVIKLEPPAGAFGPLDGYDLLEESYLPGSNRFFRRTYIAYHEGAPMLWELRFYVRPDGTVSLNAFAFSPANPFEYLATPDMLLNRWFE